MARKDVKKEVRYLNKDFSSFRNDLMDFAKVYFPNTYNDFNESSPGMMFIEMASYVGDVLSYYVDSAFKENLLAYAEEQNNIVRIAQSLGYKPKLSSPSMVNMDVFIVVPNDSSDILNPTPDVKYCPIILAGMELTPTNGTAIFTTLEDCDFRNPASPHNNVITTVYEKDADGNPTRWLLKKTGIKAQSGTKKSFSYTFGDPQKFITLEVPDGNVIEITNATDSDGNKWYETPYLAQDTIFAEAANSAAEDPELAQYADSAPYLLRLKKTSRRFITRINNLGNVEIRFGSGVSDSPDEEIIPNPDNVGSQLPGSAAKIDFSYDPSNFLYTRTYGSVPNNTTITFDYVTGVGVGSNVQANIIKDVSFVEFDLDEEALDLNTVNKIKGSLAVNNPDAATGGRGAETPEEIRMNALSHFATQNRAVTMEDYTTRVYSLPSKYGSVSKVYIVQDEQLNSADNNVVTSDNRGKAVKTDGGGTTSTKPKSNGTFGDGNVLNAGFVKPPIPDGRTNPGPARIPNPLALNFYTLGYDSDKRLIQLNDAVKENLKTYLSQYRLLTDAINIKNGYIINIGVRFQIATLRDYNKRDVVARCIERVKGFFDIDKWQINQPIVKADLIYEMSLVDGVQNVIDIEIFNKWDTDEGYSGNVYNIEEATRNEIVYPSADPSIFELKYYKKDIEGRSI